MIIWLLCFAILTLSHRTGGLTSAQDETLATNDKVPGQNHAITADWIKSHMDKYEYVACICMACTDRDEDQLFSEEELAENFERKGVSPANAQEDAMVSLCTDEIL